MNELVIMKSEQALTTSLKVAETFEKTHRHVLRDIDSLKKMCPILGRCFKRQQQRILTEEISVHIT